jgi:hypothetical protein
MANEIFLFLSIAESAVMWMSVLVIFTSLRKLSAGDFKKLATWTFLMIVFFTCTITATAAESQDIATDVLARRHVFTILISVCTVKVALMFQKFVGTYAFPKPTTAQKRLEEWIKNY